MNAMKRVIFLVDMNAFFISCEMVRNPALRGFPAAVAGDPKNRTGIILAANYEARAFGVRTAMVLHEALKLCPGMILVPPDHDYYGEMSHRVMSILDGFTPVVEQNSIDEAFLDMTGCECLSGAPVEAAGQIMEKIESTLGLWCSIGIAENRFLAKMASEIKKPKGITTIWPDEVPVKLWPLPVRAMYGVGGKTADRLARMGVQTIGDLARIDLSFLIRIFGRWGEDMHRHANGMDSDVVVPHDRDEMKSIGRSTTLPEDVSDLAKVRQVLLELADDVARSARRHGKTGHTVQITLKYADFQVVTRQMTILPTHGTHDISQAGWRLLEQNWNPARPVRLIGISLSGFDEPQHPVQLSLFDMIHDSSDLRQPVSSAKSERIDQTMDELRKRFGTDAIKRASLVKKMNKGDKKTDQSDREPDNGDR